MGDTASSVTTASLEVRGAFRAPDGVERALQERTR